MAVGSSVVVTGFRAWALMAGLLVGLSGCASPDSTEDGDPGGTGDDAGADAGGDDAGDDDAGDDAGVDDGGEGAEAIGDAPSPDPVDWPHLPVLMLDTAGQNIPNGTKVEGTLQVVMDHDGTLTDLGTAPLAFEGPMGIEVRGSSSVGFPKNSFGMEIRDLEGSDADYGLLGMAAESDWVLHGPYSDKTYLRNLLAYQLGSAIAETPGELPRQAPDPCWQPATELAEVVINGTYWGIYVVTEKIKRSSARVDLPAPAPTAAEGDLSGGYIFKREDGGEGQGWTSSRGTIYDYHDPRYVEITGEQAAWLQAHLNGFESVMAGPDAGDEETGYPAWIDVLSFVDFAIVQELTRNVDGYRKSGYTQKIPDEDGGWLVMGPLWDFNIALGNADYCGGGSPEGGFVWSGQNLCADLDRVPFWWHTLMEDDAFQDAIRCRWDQLRSGVLTDAAVLVRIDDQVARLRDAEARDHERWEVIGTYVWPNPYVGTTWQEDLDWLRNWTLERMSWLDENWPGSCN